MVCTERKQRKAASGVVVAVIIVVIVAAGLFSGYVFATMRNGSITASTTNTTTGTTSSGSLSSTTTSSVSATDSTKVSSSSRSTGPSSSTTGSVSTSYTTSTSSTGPVIPAGGSEVVIPPGIQDADAKQQNITYQPENLKVVVGVNNTIYWYDADMQDNLGHVIESVSWPSSSQPFWFEILPGQVDNVTLTVPGTYIYNCEWHPVWMSGTITVVSG